MHFSNKNKGAVMRISNSIAELRQQIRNDLRVQHPEWVEPNGGCPKCDSYESRLAELLEGFTRTGSNESVAAVHRHIEQASI
jgi:hypothetical protein